MCPGATEPGVACGDGELCVAGVCQASCQLGFTECDGRCVDTTIDPNNCESCGVTCPGATNALGFCSAGVCGVGCADGYADCSPDGSPDCDVHVDADPTHCGACDNLCPTYANAAPTCDLGTCGSVCLADRGDCDNDPTNGCEADLLSDALNCAGCGIVCDVATPTCVVGVCTFIPFNTGTFTTAGAVGRFGPTQAMLDAAYVGTELEGEVTIGAQPGIQLWTIPATATYRIEAWGARGGTQGGQPSGLGARLQGDFALSAGTTLKLLVGQPGADMSGGSGGGGSFVALADNTPLIVAGGGGYFYVSAISDASLSTSGKTGDGSNPGAGGVNGNGGNGAVSTGPGGGGGFYSNGTWGTYNGEPGFAFVNGGNGGHDESNGDTVAGGFGGGAGAGAGGHGGGAGGYSGGGASGNGGTGGSGQRPASRMTS